MNIPIIKLRKILVAFMIVFTTIFFITTFADHWFMRVICPLLSMGGNVLCAFFFGYTLGDKNNGK